jgi:hypothetical protein
MSRLIPLRQRSSENTQATLPNAADLLIDLATGIAIERGSRRRAGGNEPPPITRSRELMPPLGINASGSISVVDGLPQPRSTPRATIRPPTFGDIASVFGAAAPSTAPGPAPRRPGRRRRARPKRRGRPARTRPNSPARPSTPVIPESPEPAPRPSSPRGVPIPRLPGVGLPNLWRRLFDEYFRPRQLEERIRKGSRAPRRGGSRTRQPTPPGRVLVPQPGPLPVDLPTPEPRSQPSEIFQPRPALPSPFPDPYGQPAPASQPAPRTAPAPAARRRALPLLGNPLPWSLPQIRAGNRQQPRRATPSNPGRRRNIPSTEEFLRPQRAPRQNLGPLTALQPGRVELPQQASSPCQQLQRDAKRRQRRKRKECKKFVYKRIKVCQSSNAK